MDTDEAMDVVGTRTNWSTMAESGIARWLSRGLQPALTNTLPAHSFSGPLVRRNRPVGHLGALCPRDAVHWVRTVDLMAPEAPSTVRCQAPQSSDGNGTNELG